MPHTIKIESSGHATKVWVDGEEMYCLTGVRFEHKKGEVPYLDLRMQTVTSPRYEDTPNAKEQFSLIQLLAEAMRLKQIIQPKEDASSQNPIHDEGECSPETNIRIESDH